MVGGCLGAGVLVDRDHIDVGGRVTFDSYDRQTWRQAGQCVRQRIEGRDDHDTLDALVDEATDGLAYGGSLGGAQARNGDEVLRLQRGLLDAVERGGRAVQRAVEGDDAQRL